MADERLWHTLTVDETLVALAVDGEHGLSEAEASRRLAQTAPNILVAREGPPAWRRLLSQFNDFMIWVLLVAVAITAFTGDAPEAIAILTIVVVNAVLGFVQESRAARALAALEQLSAPDALVVRDGRESLIPAAGLVYGDVVILGSGDRIPADSRIVEAVAMYVDEAALTGESVPVHKDTRALDDRHLPLGDRRDLVFAGTHVESGRGRAAVFATGMSTEMGKIAELLEAPDERTPLQDELRTVGQRIALFCLAVSAIVFTTGVFRGNPAAEMFLVAVSLAVAAIPEGLPAVITVALALAVQRMAARNALVRKLHAVETLGSTDTICTDKTGTLTLNEMTVTSLASVDQEWAADLAAGEQGPELEWLRTIAYGCNDARLSAEGAFGDPTEVALLRFAGEMPPPERLDEIGFDSDRKRMTVVVRLPDDRVAALVKGAPDVVLARCSSYSSGGSVRPLDERAREAMVGRIEAMASAGRRTLAAAYRLTSVPWPADPDSLEDALVFVGLYGLADPPRPGVAEAIAVCRAAHIRVVMITGDHLLTAQAIGAEIGLPAADAVTGTDLDLMSAAELRDRVEDIGVFARVSPSHKLRIVEALQDRGHSVAMTGDGVNDAPALKRADIGVAMGRVGTDVAREASDMVLADDDFATIVSAVREGRAVFDDIRKVVLFLLSCNVSEVLVVFFATVFMNTIALLPLQILWINLITDGLPALALGVDPPAGDLMRMRPRLRAEGILVWRRQLQTGIQGGLISLGALGALFWGMAVGATMRPGVQMPFARTLLFTTMVLTQLLHAFTFRSASSSIFSTISVANKALVGAFLGSAALQLAVLYVPTLARVFGAVPLGLGGWGIVAACSLGPIVAIDLLKRRSGSLARQ